MTGRNASLVCALLLTALSARSSAMDFPELSGFLGDYMGMHQSTEIEGIFVVSNNDKKIVDYSRFLIDPITVQLSRNAVAYRMDENELKSIAKNFRGNIIAALETSNSIVNEPGPGVCRVRVAITDILKTGKKGAVGIIEAEFIDSTTEERIVAAVTSDKGMKLNEWTDLLRDRLTYLHSQTRVFQFE